MFRVPTADIYIYIPQFPLRGGGVESNKRDCHRDCEADSERKFVRMSPDSLAQSLAQYLPNCNCICATSVCRSLCLLLVLFAVYVVFVFAVVALMCFLYKVMSIGQQTCCRLSAHECVCVPVCTQVASATTYQQTAPPPFRTYFPCGNPQIAP